MVDDGRPSGPVHELTSSYVDHVGYVRNYFFWRLADRDLAEDLAQETFLKAWRKQHLFHGGNYAAWLTTIARNTFLDHVDSGRRRPEVLVDDVTLRLMSDDAQSDTVPQAELLDRMVVQERHEALGALIKSLTPDQQRCLTLRYEHGLSVIETAEALGKSENATKVLHHRAIRSLRRLLDATSPRCLGSEPLSG